MIKRKLIPLMLTAVMALSAVGCSTPKEETAPQEQTETTQTGEETTSEEQNDSEETTESEDQSADNSSSEQAADDSSEQAVDDSSEQAADDSSEQEADGKLYNIGDFKATDIDGNEVTRDVLKDYDLTLVNVWTTWCTYCLEEMPYLAELSEEMKDQGVQFLSIVNDVADPESGEIDEEKMELTKTIRERTGVKFPILLPDKVFHEGILRTVTGYPATYLVDSEGRFITQPISGALKKDQWKQLIEEVLTLMKEQK